MDLKRPLSDSDRDGDHVAPRRVTILGSTGSVGVSTLSVLNAVDRPFRVVALTANRNVEQLVEQARRLRPEFVAIADPDRHGDLKAGLDGTGIVCGAGPEAVLEAASRETDWVMAAIVGAAGLAPTLAAVRQGAMVAFANKEVLVCAGSLVMRAAREHNATVLPVDSEHNAIFQVFEAAQRDAIERITLTASGGPFRTWDAGAMASVTPEQAVAHPVWSMGAKISVDSATMMNKGLEVIEAHHLFDLPCERIDVLVHPQSIVHGLVHYADGSVLAQLGWPDMRTPITHALCWPERGVSAVRRLDLAAAGRLDFFAPDTARFPCLALARAALQTGGAAPTILNAANEVAVHRFLRREIAFLDIPAVVERVLAGMAPGSFADLGELVALDVEARRLATAA